jgi:hypothetical protein
MLSLTMEKLESQNGSNTREGLQPVGADGFGRAGYGYAGSINPLE